jgi:hypothetical protein
LRELFALQENRGCGGVLRPVRGQECSVRRVVQRVGEDRIPLMRVPEKLIECSSISASLRGADAKL